MILCKMNTSSSNIKYSTVIMLYIIFCYSLKKLSNTPKSLINFQRCEIKHLFIAVLTYFANYIHIVDSYEYMFILDNGNVLNVHVQQYSACLAIVFCLGLYLNITDYMHSNGLHMHIIPSYLVC